MDVDGGRVMEDLLWLLPGLREEVACPACTGQEILHSIRAWDGTVTTEICTRSPHEGDISFLIQHLNDTIGWEREEVADWLETLDVDLTFPAEPPPRPERPKVEHITVTDTFVGGKTLGKLAVWTDAQFTSSFIDFNYSLIKALDATKVLSDALAAAKRHYVCAGLWDERDSDEPVDLGQDDTWVLPKRFRARTRPELNPEETARRAWAAGRDDKIWYTPAWGLKASEEYPTPRVGKKGRDRAGNPRGRGSYTR